MDVMQPFFDISADPKAYARSWKDRTGGNVIGTLCSYAPEELILAAGALGFRIVGGSGAISKADAHLQAYSCSLVRGALEDALSNQLDFLDGTIFPHTCDSIQRLSDIWRMNAKTGFHLDVVLPVKLNTDSAREYMTAVMRKARSELENILGKAIYGRRSAAGCRDLQPYPRENENALHDAQRLPRCDCRQGCPRHCESRPGDGPP